MHVLDSSAIIESMQQGPLAKKVAHVVGEEQLVTTSICMHELLLGAHSEMEQFVLEKIFSTMRILEHDSQAARFSSRIERELVSNGAKIGGRDCLIAGICKAHNAELVTLDNDFARI